MCIGKEPNNVGERAEENYDGIHYVLHSASNKLNIITMDI